MMVGTREAQQIAKENVETINFYGNMIFGAHGIYGLIILFDFYQSTEISMALLWPLLPFILESLIYFRCFRILSRFGTPKTSEPNGKGQLIKPGLDLNMNEVAKHVKEAIILTVIAQFLSLLSYYFLLVIFIAPIHSHFYCTYP